MWNLYGPDRSAFYRHHTVTSVFTKVYGQFKLRESQMWSFILWLCHYFCIIVNLSPEASHFFSLLTAQSASQHLSHSNINTVMTEAAMQGANCTSGAVWDSISCSRTLWHAIFFLICSATVDIFNSITSRPDSGPCSNPVWTINVCVNLNVSQRWKKVYVEFRDVAS